MEIEKDPEKQFFIDSLLFPQQQIEAYKGNHLCLLCPSWRLYMLLKTSVFARLPGLKKCEVTMGKVEGDEASNGGMKQKQKQSQSSSSSSLSSFGSVFRHADAVDKLLMTLGFVGAVGDGMSMPTMLLLTSKIFNNLGGGSIDSPDFTHAVNEV